MPKFAANLSTMFPELEPPDRFAALDALGYDGWVGCEYAPKGDTWAGLSWAVPYGFSAARGLKP